MGGGAATNAAATAEARTKVRLKYYAHRGDDVAGRGAGRQAAVVNADTAAVTASNIITIAAAVALAFACAAGLATRAAVAAVAAVAALV